jgi:hypothetical protein
LKWIKIGAYSIGALGLFKVGNTMYTYGTEAGLEGLMSVSNANGTWALMPNTGGIPASNTLVDLVNYDGDFFVGVKSNSVWNSGGIINSVEDIANTTSFSVYPIPADQGIVINSKGTDSIFEIYNSQGQLVKTGKITSPSSRIDVIDLESGTYFLRLLGSKIETKSLIIQH